MGKSLMSSVMDNVSKIFGIYLNLPPYDGYCHPAAGYQRRRKRLLCIRRWYPLWTFCDQKRGKAGRRRNPGRTEEKRYFQFHGRFINRMTNKEVNRRTIENFIKSGAMDSLPGTRRQKVAVAPILLDNKARERKNAWEGQMSLFDLVSEEEKKEYQVSFPDVGEYSKEELLAFEKDILGVYISGHPLDDYEGLWRKNITATSADFIVDEETEEAVVKDGMKVVIGGLVAGKVVKTTRSNQLMAFITLEDLMGSVEVIVFPKNYEADRDVLTEDSKIFIKAECP